MIPINDEHETVYELSRRLAEKRESKVIDEFTKLGLDFVADDPRMLFSLAFSAGVHTGMCAMYELDGGIAKTSLFWEGILPCNRE